MKKFVAMMVTFCMLFSMVPMIGFSEETETVTPGYKSGNYNLLKAMAATYVTFGGDRRGNDGDTSTNFNHTNRNQDDNIYMIFDLKTQWQAATSGNGFLNTTGTELSSVPKYNKLVFTAHYFNAQVLTAMHSSQGMLSGSGAPQFINPTIVGTRDIYSHRDNVNANARQVFSFDSTSDRYVGFHFKYMIGHNANGKSAGYYTAYTKEVEVYYVTPERMEIDANSVYVVAPGGTFQPKVKFFDKDNDEVLDKELTSVVWSINAENATIDPDTGVVTMGPGFSNMENVTVTATSTVPGLETLTASATIQVLDATQEGMPVGVKIDPPQSIYKVHTGDTIQLTGHAVDMNNNPVVDEEIISGLIWSMETTCPQLSIDSKTGLITVSGGITDIYDVKVSLALNGTYNFVDTVTFKVGSSKKSVNYNLGATAVSNWTAPTLTTDGDFGTINHGGNHSAGTWVFAYTLKDWSEPKLYNKAVVHYTKYNTEYLSFNTGTSISNYVVSGGLDEIRKDLGYDHKTTNVPMKQYFSFDAVDHPYISFTNKYLRATNNEDEYKGQNPTISEVQLFYVLPVEIVIKANDTYTANVGAQISLDAEVLDVDGDVILDSNLSGIKWSLVSGGDKVSIVQDTGVITINEKITTDTKIIVRAESTAPGQSLAAEKEITLTGSAISYIELVNVPDFIMTNTEQSSESTITLNAKAYDHSGNELPLTSFVWSLEKAVEGVSLTSNGKLTVAGNAPIGEIQIMCKSSDMNETAVVQKSIKINEKIDLVRNKVGWTINGWQTTDGEVSKAVDGDASTSWDSGNHSRGSAIVVYNIGEGNLIKANYFKLRLGNINNSTMLRIAGSDKLVRNGVVDAEPPTKADQTFASSEFPTLYPWTSNAAFQGTTLWSGRTVGQAETGFDSDHEILSNEVGGYFKGGTQELKYIGIINYAKDITDKLGKFTVSDFEVYNTSLNYVSIELPEDQVVTSTTTIPLTAVIHNGVDPEYDTDSSNTEKGAMLPDIPEGATGTWSAVGFSIDANTGVLTVPDSNDFILGTITYNYNSANFNGKATIYVCNDVVEGQRIIRFSNTPTEFLGLQLEKGLSIEGDTIYVPSTKVVEDLLSGAINSNKVSISVYVVDLRNGLEIIESGEVLEEYKIYVVYEDIQMVYNIQIASDRAISLSKTGQTYTASFTARRDLPNAVLVIAEYQGTKLVRVQYVEKVSDVQTLSVSLENVPDGNTVKALLFDSFHSMLPLVQKQAL